MEKLNKLYNELMIVISTPILNDYALKHLNWSFESHDVTVIQTAAKHSDVYTRSSNSLD